MDLVAEGGSLEPQVRRYILPKETVEIRSSNWGSLASDEFSEDDCGDNYSATLTIEPEYDGRIEIDVTVETGGELSGAPASSTSHRTCSELEVASYTVVENTV